MSPFLSAAPRPIILAVPGEEGQVYIRLQPEASEDLVFAAGFPVFPPPMPYRPVRVDRALPCPACERGDLSREWRLERTGVAIVGSGCWRHVFVVELPRWLRPGSGQ